MLGFDYDKPPRSYKSYKAEQFNKKVAKMQNLVKSVDATSLKPEDKIKLKTLFKELL